MIQKTLVLIKPDGVKRNLIGKIINYYEEGGLVVKELKMIQADPELVKQHYPEDEEYLRSIGEKSQKSDPTITDVVGQGRKVVGWLQDYLTMGPIVAMVLEGEEAVPLVRKITGFTDPTQADKGTIRGDLGEDSIVKANAENRPCYNMIHASGNPEEAEKELSIWFPQE